MKPAKPAAILAVSLALGLLFDLLFFDNIPGISVLLYVAAIAAGLLGLARALNHRLPAATLWLLAPLGFFAAMVAVRASYQLTALNILACLGLLLLIAGLALRDQLRRFTLLDYVKLALLPLQFLAPLSRTLADIFALRVVVAKHPQAAQVTRGLLLAAPILAVFLLLFASADLVFQHYVTNLLDLHLEPVTVVRSILITIVTLAFAGAYSFVFSQSRQPATPTSDQPAGFRLGHLEASIVLGSVSALFLAFIVVQLAYLFGGLANISGQGFTYAEYARKGFFELVTAAVITFGLLWATDKTTRQPTTGHTLAFRLLASTLIVQVLLIMASAFKRLYLYEQAFGFTTLRLYSHTFVIFLAIVFGLLLIKILRNQAEHRFAFPAFITALLFLAGLNALNPDAFIARQNLDR